MSENRNNQHNDSGGPALPCDRRYRTHQYFLEDQLRCSDAVADFQSVKSLLSGASAFNLRGAFRFQAATVPVRADD